VKALISPSGLIFFILTDHGLKFRGLAINPGAMHPNGFHKPLRKNTPSTDCHFPPETTKAP
uniref:hypothetical protein n=1 Tax=Parasutterella excrementihominis TaxID=487175 RepID=UPI003FEFBB63